MDKTITAGSVLASANAQKVLNGIAGATITAGQTLYQDADQSLKLCDCNAAAPANVFKGWALNSAAAGQPIAYALQDPGFIPGCAVAIGEVLIVSTTPGGVAPIADAATGDFIIVLGVGTGSNKLNFLPVAAGVAATSGFST